MVEEAGHGRLETPERVGTCSATVVGSVVEAGGLETVASATSSTSGERRGR